jgi:hypothetical protein
MQQMYRDLLPDLQDGAKAAEVYINISDPQVPGGLRLRLVHMPYGVSFIILQVNWDIPVEVIQVSDCQSGVLKTDCNPLPDFYLCFSFTCFAF